MGQKQTQAVERSVCASLKHRKLKQEQKQQKQSNRLTFEYNKQQTTNSMNTSKAMTCALLIGAVLVLCVMQDAKAQELESNRKLLQGPQNEPFTTFTPPFTAEQIDQLNAENKAIFKNNKKFYKLQFQEAKNVAKQQFKFAKAAATDKAGVKAAKQTFKTAKQTKKTNEADNREAFADQADNIANDIPPTSYP